MYSTFKNCPNVSCITITETITTLTRNGECQIFYFLRPLEMFESDKGKYTNRSVNLVLNQLILVLVQIPKLFLKFGNTT